jgi:hypothetical protein
MQWFITPFNRRKHREITCTIQFLIQVIDFSRFSFEVALRSMQELITLRLFENLSCFILQCFYLFGDEP